MDVKDIKLPVSAIVGGIAGFSIGFLIGVISGGFILEILARSILSGIILGGTLFVVELVIRKFAPEILEENVSKPNRVDIKEEDNLSISDLYEMSYEGEADKSEDELQSYLDSSMTFSESSVFGNEVENILEDEKILERVDLESDVGVEEKEDRFSSFDFDKVSKTETINFEPITFSPAELGVTKQSKGGVTENFIITGKGKLIPKDYKKLAEAIRTKLKEE